MVYYYYCCCILIRYSKASGISFFIVSPLLLTILTPLFLHSSSVSLSYFIFAVTMRECLGKDLFMSCQFPIAILNGTFFCSSVKAINNFKWSAIKQIPLN